MTERDNTVNAVVAVGSNLAGYQLAEQIGQGILSVVFRARDQRLDRIVALKVISGGQTGTLEFRTRFIQVTRAAANIDDRHIIPVYDIGETSEYVYVAMRYVAGGSSRSLLDQGESPPVDRVWKIISQAASALDAAHQHNLIHSNIKPSNLLLGQAHNHRDHVYLSDFGIGVDISSAPYAAPEKLAGEPLDGQADQYSLACVAFELFIGLPPFGRMSEMNRWYERRWQDVPVPSAHALRAEVPAAVDPVFVRALAGDPADRYASCTEFADDLGRALGLVSEIGNGHWITLFPPPSPPVPRLPTPSEPTPSEQTPVWQVQQPYGGTPPPSAGAGPISVGSPTGQGSWGAGSPGSSKPSAKPGRTARRAQRSARSVKTAGRDDWITRAVKETVRPGLLAFNPPAQMHQGRSERVEVGIARSANLRDELTAGFRGRGLAEVLPVPASPAMGVELRGSSFEIEALSPAEQLIVPLARWEFDVTPVRAGSQTLTLCVSLRIDSPAVHGGRIAVPVLERQIQIRVNVGFGIRHFTTNNWQWVAGTVIGLGGGIAAWIDLVH